MSSSILDRPTPFPEANWKEFQTETKHLVSKESFQKDFGASSDRSGNQESESEKPAGVYSPIEKCGFCSGMHDAADCKYLLVMSMLEKREAPKVPSTEECSICHDKHATFDCDRTDLIYVDNPVTYNPDGCGFCFGNHDSADCKFPNLISEPDNEDSEVPSKIECCVCREEHLTSACSCWTSVPRNTYVSPFFFILCKRCGGEISNNLKCQPCEMEVQGYVIPRTCCRCGERMSSDCCQFGERISKMNGYITPALHVIMEDMMETADQ